MLPVGVFINDMDLMEEYCDDLAPDEEIYIFLKGKWRRMKWSEGGLPNLIKFRKSRYDILEAYNYFGEYLSQGKLKIEGACTIIPFDRIINPKLYELYPGFKDLMNGNRAEWAKPVMEFRKKVYRGVPKPTTTLQVQAVVAITA